jgi:hypothetical protein
MHWNGTAWKRAPVAVRGQLTGVAAGPAGLAWAVGTRYTAASSAPVVARWNGRAWVRVPSPEPRGGSLLKMAIVSARDAWAVGSITSRTLILHWNGRAWS